MDGKAYEFVDFCADSFTSGYWLFFYRRPAGQEDMGEDDLLDDIVWSFRDIYRYH